MVSTSLDFAKEPVWKTCCRVYVLLNLLYDDTTQIQNTSFFFH